MELAGAIRGPSRRTLASAALLVASALLSFTAAGAEISDPCLGGFQGLAAQSFPRADRAAIASFLTARAENARKGFGFELPLRGTSATTLLSFRGRPLRAFHRLGSGKDGSAYLAVWNGAVVVAKKFDASPGATAKLRREAWISRHLAAHDAAVSEVLDAAEPDGLLLKAYVVGADPRELKDLEHAGKLDPARLRSLEAERETFRDRLYRISRRPEFLEACLASRFPFCEIDDVPENLLFDGTRWVLVDP